MKLTLWEQDIRYEARTEGREEGIEEGRAEGKAKGIAEGKAAGIVEGRAEGELINLINLIRRKIAKGKTLEAIAEDLDEELEKVKRVYDVVSRHSPDDDIEVILREVAERV